MLALMPTHSQKQNKKLGVKNRVFYFYLFVFAIFITYALGKSRQILLKLFTKP